MLQLNDILSYNMPFRAKSLDTSLSFSVSRQCRQFWFKLNASFITHKKRSVTVVPIALRGGRKGLR